MAKVVYLAASSPTRLAEELTRGGHDVFKALSVSEVLYLCEHHTIDAVVIAPEVAEPELIEVQIRHTTIKLEQSAKVADIIWELSNLFPPSDGMTVQ